MNEQYNIEIESLRSQIQKIRDEILQEEKKFTSSYEPGMYEPYREINQEKKSKAKLQLDYDRLIGEYEIITLERQAIIERNKDRERRKEINKKTLEKNNESDNKIIANYNAALEVARKIEGNPFVFGTSKELARDSINIEILNSFVNDLSNDQLRKNNEELMKFLSGFNEVYHNFYNIVSSVKREANYFLNILESFYEKKNFLENIKTKFKDKSKIPTVSGNISAAHDVFKNFKQDVSTVIGIHEREYNEEKLNAIKKARISAPKVGNLKDAKILEGRIGRVSGKKGFNTNTLSKSLQDVDMLEIIEIVEKSLLLIQNELPEMKNYSGYDISFEEVHKCVNNLLNKCKLTRDNIQARLVKNGYSDEKNKVVEYDNKTKIVNSLGTLYKELNRDLTGTRRKEILNEIEETLNAQSLSEEQKESYRLEAEELGKQFYDAELADKGIKAKERKEKERRELSISHIELVTDEEIERLYREAEMAANRKFSNNYVHKSGDVYDLNAQDRIKFIEKYVSDEATKLATFRYDQKRSDEKSRENQEHRYLEKISDFGLNQDMLEYSERLLRRDGLLTEDELTPEDRIQIADYAIRLKSLVGKSEEEVAAAMLQDVLNRNGDTETKLSQQDITTQMNLNRYRNIYANINDLFKDQEMKM